jgi:transcriptional regulator with XRE-family HTH domain
MAATRKLNGTAVRVIRELLGVRNGDLALRIQVTPSTVTHIERADRQVSAETQRRLADALGVPLEAITYPTEPALEQVSIAA